MEQHFTGLHNLEFKEKWNIFNAEHLMPSINCYMEIDALDTVP